MAAGPVETEIKLRVTDVEGISRLLDSLGYKVKKPRIFEANAVYDRNGEVRAAGSLLRLRLAGDRAVLTFKGPGNAGRHKSRPETEIVVSDFDSCASILMQLGYTVSFRYEKYRTEHGAEGEPGVITVDETPIGAFLELEGPSDWIDATAARLGYTESDYVTASYAGLYLSFCREKGIEPSHMTF
jgi:adenylate cyclase class 2